MNPVRWKPIALFVYSADKPDIYPASKYDWDLRFEGIIVVWSVDGKERYEYYGDLPHKIVYAAEPDEEKKEEVEA
jgi:hypothetical protein